MNPTAIHAESTRRRTASSDTPRDSTGKTASPVIALSKASMHHTLDVHKARRHAEESESLHAKRPTELASKPVKENAQGASTRIAPWKATRECSRRSQAGSRSAH